MVILLETIQSMFNHLHWANQRILETLQNGKRGIDFLRCLLNITSIIFVLLLHSVF